MGLGVGVGVGVGVGSNCRELQTLISSMISSRKLHCQGVGLLSWISVTLCTGQLLFD